MNRWIHDRRAGIPIQHIVTFAHLRHFPGSIRDDFRRREEGLRNADNGGKEWHVLADKENIDSAKIKFVEVRQGCDTIST